VSKKLKKDDLQQFNAFIASIVAKSRLDPALPEIGIHYSRLLAQGIQEVDVIRLVGSTLVAHLCLEAKTHVPVDRGRLRFELSKLPYCELFGADRYIDLTKIMKP